MVYFAFLFRTAGVGSIPGIKGVEVYDDGEKGTWQWWTIRPANVAFKIAAAVASLARSNRSQDIKYLSISP